MHAAKIQTYLLSGITLLIAVAIIKFPEVSVEASKNGLNMWWNVVFPSLLPFFIIAELLIGFGIVAFIGVLLEPFMRPIFRVPGVGGFVFTMGLVSGFPAGAKITARLYEEKQLSKTEAERLASFTNFSNPLFMYGVVAYKFFGNLSLGLIFALSHYIGNIMVGLMMRFYKGEETERLSRPPKPKQNVFVRALNHMHEERLRNYKPMGKMLGDAVQSSVSTLLMVGGFIILFSVLNQLFAELKVTDFFAFLLQHLFFILQMEPTLSQGLIPGLFEITVGSRLVSGLDAPLIQAVIVTSFILGFSGFSIQAQVASILAEQRLNSKPFFIGRVFHGLFAAVASGVLFIYLHDFISKETISVVNQSNSPAFWDFWMQMLQWGSIITFITLGLSVLILMKRILSIQTR